MSFFIAWVVSTTACIGAHLLLGSSTEVVFMCAVNWAAAWALASFFARRSA